MKHSRLLLLLAVLVATTVLALAGCSAQGANQSEPVERAADKVVVCRVKTLGGEEHASNKSMRAMIVLIGMTSAEKNISYQEAADRKDIPRYADTCGIPRTNK